MPNTLPIAQRLQDSLPSQRIRSLQIQYLVLLGSVVGLTLLCILMGFLFDHSQPRELKIPTNLRNMALVAGSLPLLVWPVSRIIFDQILRKNPVMQKEYDALSADESVASNLEKSWIVKAALVEFSALVCLGVLLMLLRIRDPMHLPFLYYGVLSGPAMMIVHTMAFYPSRDTIVAQFKRLQELEN